MPRFVRHRRRYTPTQIHNILTAFDSSGLSITSFAKRRRIAPTTLSRWIRQRSESRQQDESPCLVPVEVVASEVQAREPFEVHFGNGCMVRVSPTFDADALVRLLKVVKDAC